VTVYVDTSVLLRVVLRSGKTSELEIDALHLASALLARVEVPDLRFATHDRSWRWQRGR
jgi:hypothetical protein